MHPAGALFRTPGHTFSRACRGLSVATPLGRWNQIEAQPAPDLADAVDCYWEGWGEIPPLAEDFGYHDQAHLSHDFREFCGATPADYLRRASPGGDATLEEPPAAAGQGG